MFVERASRILKHFVPAVWSIDSKGKEKSVYLTFDDGPDPEVTPKVIEILDKYGIKATFFCVGQNVEKYPEVFDMIVDNNHAFGNHTMNHIKGFGTNNAIYTNNVEKASRLIDSRLFRPPYGSITFRQIGILQKKYKIVMWSVLTRDYKAKLNPQKCLSIVKRFTQNGSIIVFHDSKKAKKNLLEALPKSIEWLLSQQYTFKTIKAQNLP